MPEDGLRPPRSGSGIRIREAQASDIAELVHLETISFASDRLSRRSFAAFLRSAAAVLMVADAGRGLVGYALALTRRGSRASRLYSLAVDPRHAGRGLGSRLLDVVERAAASSGAEILRLEVRADNPAAIALYDRHGYRRIGRREDYYADGMAALCFERTLDRASAAPTSATLGRAA